MSRQSWSETIAWTTSSGTAINTTTSETSVFPNVVIPANYMQDGRTLRLTGYGVYGTTSGSNAMTLSLRWGGIVGTVIAKSGANVLTASVGGGASMTADWSFHALIQTRSNGSSGTLMTMGEGIFYTSTLGTAGTVTQYGMPVVLVSGTSGAPGTAAAVATTDLTADSALVLTATWGTSNAANNIQGHISIVESLN